MVRSILLQEDTAHSPYKTQTNQATRDVFVEEELSGTLHLAPACDLTVYHVSLYIYVYIHVYYIQVYVYNVYMYICICIYSLDLP